LPPDCKFKSRVQVWSSTGRYLFHCHAEQARRLVRDGSAIPEESDGKTQGRVWKLVLASQLSCLVQGPPTPSCPASFQGQHYVRRTKVRCSATQRTSVVCCFKKIHQNDRWAFVLAQTDTMTMGQNR